MTSVLLRVETEVRQSCTVGGEDDGGDMNSLRGGILVSLELEFGHTSSCVPIAHRAVLEGGGSPVKQIGMPTTDHEQYHLNLLLLLSFSPDSIQKLDDLP